MVVVISDQLFVVSHTSSISVYYLNSGHGLLVVVVELMQLIGQLSLLLVVIFRLRMVQHPWEMVKGSDSAAISTELLS